MTGQILTIDAATYHADNIDDDRPTLSASIAKLLIDASPAHARAAHPKLNPNLERKSEDKFDVGTAAHKLLLEGETVIEVIYADSFRTKHAQEERDLARAHGRIPLLPHQANDVEAMVKAVQAQLVDFPVDPPLFVDGTPEQTLAWEENGVLCRARLDWLQNDWSAITDLKTTAVPPLRWKNRTLYDNGCDLQCALYRRAVKAVTGVAPKWRWVLVETTPPFAVSVIEPAASVLALGDAKVDAALRIWKRCLDSGDWPGYPREVIRAELPAFIEAAWLEREAREEITA